jgi:hypothetical protein
LKELCVGGTPLLLHPPIDVSNDGKNLVTQVESVGSREKTFKKLLRKNLKLLEAEREKNTLQVIVILFYNDT